MSFGDLERIDEDIFRSVPGEGLSGDSRWELAPLDESFWTTLTYTALARLRQARPRTTHPDDALAVVAQYPPGLDLPPDTITARGEGPQRLLVNHDAHLRRVSGHHVGAIPLYLRDLLCPEFESILDGPPHDWMSQDYDSVWMCPQPGCEHYETLARLSPRAIEVVRAHIPEPRAGSAHGSAPDILQVHHHAHGDRTAAHPAYNELVIDLVGVDHWETAHLGPAAGLKCVIHGQDRLHRVICLAACQEWVHAEASQLNYEWHDDSYADVLTSRTAFGIAARAFEESMRQRVQSSISIMARRWAIRTEQGVHVAASLDRDAAHEHARDAAVSALREEEMRGHPRGLSIWRQARDIHEEIYEVAADGAGARAAQEAAIAEARGLMEYWVGGDGRSRLEGRPNDPALHFLP
ncbi:hypothetical protein PENSPDRAFT_661468 [Peniophora sp. CONT]|nr:hypothetical protein PENSPDRAFT_661468 [Peniophora sp. CONT]